MADENNISTTKKRTWRHYACCVPNHTDDPDKIKKYRINKWFQIALIVFELIMIVLFLVLRDRKGEHNDYYHKHGIKVTGVDGKIYEIDGHVNSQYGSFQDVHVMVFIGFGFLMTFLKKFNWSSVSLTLMIGAVTIQWSTIVHALFFDHQTIHISFVEMYEAEFTAAAVLISFGAMLGTINHLQLLFMAILEVVFFKLNAWLLFNKLPVWMGGKQFYDIGGSMVIHAFGAYFGLACTRMIFKENMRENKKEGASYNTDLFAMIGTIFLWMYWPSFNSIPATDDFEKQVTIINTYFALTAAAVAAFATSGFGDHHHQHKFNMVHIQNSTLAGAVAIGSSANMQLDIFGALLIGAIAGVISVVGYAKLQGALLRNFNIHDTCGVYNLHGIPGILVVWWVETRILKK